MTQGPGGDPTGRERNGGPSGRERNGGPIGRERDSWADWVEGQLAAVAESGQWRRPRVLDGGGPEFVTEDGRRVVSFASNDYLGLSQHASVTVAAAEAAYRWGAGSGASRLVVGSRPVHSSLEAELASWRGAESALVFPSGYAANLSVLSTFAGPGTRIVSDELNHASIIDGCRLSRAEVCVYPHGDDAAAADLVASAPGRAILVSDTVFSMDGDQAPVAALARICAAHDALLVLDDAHVVFDLPPVAQKVLCLRVGTLSKMLGSAGGFVTGPRDCIELLVNRARPWIYTTAPAPSEAAAALAALDIVRGPEGDRRRDALQGYISRLKPGHGSPIVPVVIGSEDAAVARSEALLEKGVLVPAIRPPTVPPGTSRLRVALSAGHTEEQVDMLAEALDSPDLAE